MNAFIHLLKRIPFWSFVFLFVGIAILISEVLIIIQSYLLHGEIRSDLLIVGFFTPLIDAFIVFYIVAVLLQSLKKEEAEKTQNFSYLRSTLDNLPFLAWMKDTDGRFLAVNEAFAKACGKQSVNEVEGRCDLDVWPEQLAKKYRQEDLHVMESQQQKILEEQIADQGRVHWFETYKSPIFDDQKQVMGTVGFARDITYAKLAELESKAKNQLIETIAIALDTATDEEFFSTLTRHLAEALYTDYVFIGRYISDSSKKVKTLSVVKQGQPQNNFVYDLIGTPCETVFAENRCVIGAKVIEAFPEDHLLAEMNVEAYVGIRLSDSSGAPLGILVILNEQPIETPEFYEQIMRIFATRAAAELERHKHVENFRKLSRAVEYNPSAVSITDKNGVIEYVNSRFLELTGFTENELIGNTHKIISSGNTENQDYEDLWKVIRIGQEWRGTLQNRKKDGSIYWASEQIAPIHNEKGQITHYVCMLLDVTESIEASEKISYQATHDSLTGLINRREFDRQLELAFEQTRSGKMVHALGFLDLDQFKLINDTSGHLAGDELLKQITHIFSDALKGQEVIARLGGDEFGIIIKNTNLDEAYQRFETLRQQVDAFQFLWEEKVFNITTSIGLVSIDKQSENVLELMKQADMSCYMAKESGRNQIHIYEPKSDAYQQVSSDMEWANRISEAISDNRLALYAQSIVATKPPTQKCHFEILVRMISETGEVLSPGTFLPAAERYNLATKIDMWVIHHTFLWLKQHCQKLPNNFYLSINLSGQSLCDDTVLKRIQQQSEECAVAKPPVKFEVTETAAIANLQKATHFISTLKSLGYEIVLDDFGSGLSSFAYLKALDVDILKIDGIFVRDLLRDHKDEAMVKTFNDIAHTLGLCTVAEFVETADHIEKLKEIGVDFIQGYAIDKPQPIDEILKELEKC